MKVLFDASVLGYNNTGLSKSLLYLYSHCKRIDEGFVAYGFGCEETDSFRYHDYGIELIDCRSNLQIRRFIRDNGIDIIHYPCNFGGYIRAGIPQALTLHDLIRYELGEFRRPLRPLRRARYLLKVRLSIRNADIVFTPSEYSRAAIESFAKHEVETRVIPWGVTLPDCLAERPPEGVPMPYFLYAGGYTSRKGIDRLVLAYTRLVDEGETSCKLVLAGRPHPIDDFTDSLIRRGVEGGSIVQTGYVSDEDLCGLYSHAICSVYLSESEGFGLPVIESMRYGCPVVTCRNTSLVEVGGIAACYVDRDDLTEVHDMLLRLERDEGFRSSRVALGMENVGRFSWDNSARSFLRNLDEVVKQHGATRVRKGRRHG